MNTTVKNLTNEELARRQYEMLCDPMVVRTRVCVEWRNGICLPVESSEEYEEAEFKVLTFGDNHVIDKVVSYDVDIVESGEVKATTTAIDLNEYKRLLLRKNLIAWTLDIPIERENGWMTEECWKRVSSIPGPLMDAFISQYERSASITVEEERKIERQSVLLFSPNGRGVSNACEAISLFCTLGNFWEKFGVGRGTPLHEIPLREYAMLKMIMSKEGEAAKPHKDRPLTKIAGPGGKVRPSRGIVVRQ